MNRKDFSANISKAYRMNSGLVDMKAHLVLELLEADGANDRCTVLGRLRLLLETPDNQSLLINHIDEQKMAGTASLDSLDFFNQSQFIHYIDKTIKFKNYSLFLYVQIIQYYYYYYYFLSIFPPSLHPAQAFGLHLLLSEHTLHISC